MVGNTNNRLYYYRTTLRLELPILSTEMSDHERTCQNQVRGRNIWSDT
jgi:hypothetical protein